MPNQKEKLYQVFDAQLDHATETRARGWFQVPEGEGNHIRPNLQNSKRGEGNSNHQTTGVVWIVLTNVRQERFEICQEDGQIKATSKYLAGKGRLSQAQKE